MLTTLLSPPSVPFSSSPLVPLTIGELVFVNSGRVDGFFLGMTEKEENKPFTVVLGGEHGVAEVALTDAALVSLFKATVRPNARFTFGVQFRGGGYRPTGAERGKPCVEAVGYRWQAHPHGGDLSLTRGTLDLSGIVTRRNGDRVELVIPSPLGRKSHDHDALVEFDGAAWLNEPILLDPSGLPVDDHPIWDLVSSLGWRTLTLTPGSNLRYVGGHEDDEIRACDLEVGDLVRLDGWLAPIGDSGELRKAIEIVDWTIQGNELSRTLAHIL
jgi:hypothetical protein